MKKSRAERRKDGYRNWRSWHGWLGVLAGLVLILQGLTGALLGYEREIRNALGDGAVEKAETRLSPEELVAASKSRIGEGSPAWIIWREDPAEPVWVSWRNPAGATMSYLFNPYTSEFLPASTKWHRVYETILSIHRRLGTGRVGQVVMGSSAFILLSLIVSGLVLQARRSNSVGRMLGFRRKPAEREGRSALRWWHAVAGIWLTPFLLIIALTGPVWTFETYRDLIGWVTRSEPQYGKAPSLPEKNPDSPVNTAAILKSAQAHVPASGAMRIIFPSTPANPARFEWAPADAPFENFRSRLWLDPLTGEVLRTEPLSGYTAAETAIRWAYPLHTGMWGGFITQFLHVAAALSLPFFAISGGYLFFKRIRNQKTV